MDTVLINTYEKTLKDVENVIYDTNKVIYRWVKINNVHISKITEDEIKSILLGKLRKLICSNSRWQDFKRFSKCISSIKINRDLLIIDAILIKDYSEYSYQNTYTSHINKSFENIDYNKLQFDPNEEILKDIDTNLYITFNEIEEITF